MVDVQIKRTTIAIDSVRFRSIETSERQAQSSKKQQLLQNFVDHLNKQNTNDRISPDGDCDDVNRRSVKLYKLVAISSLDVLFGDNRKELFFGKRASRVNYDDQRLLRSATRIRGNDHVFVLSCSCVILFVTVN